MQASNNMQWQPFSFIASPAPVIPYICRVRRYLSSTAGSENHLITVIVCLLRNLDKYLLLLQLLEMDQIYCILFKDGYRMCEWDYLTNLPGYQVELYYDASLPSSSSDIWITQLQCHSRHFPPDCQSPVISFRLPARK